MPTYTIMSCALPKESLKEIHVLHRNFIWGDTESEKHTHAINWSIINSPKMMSNLGLRNLIMTNKVCLLKFGWELLSGDNSLWCQVLRGKYGWGGENFRNVTIKLTASSFGRILVRIGIHYSLSFIRMLGIGKQPIPGPMLGSLRRLYGIMKEVQT